MRHQFFGNHPAMVTPFTDDGGIDEPSLAKLVEHFIAGGVHGILALGTTGEAFSLETEERKSVAEFVIQQVNGRVPVGVMTGYTGTHTSLELGRHACEAGANYLLLPPPPSAFPLSGRGLASYYLKVAQAVEIPVMIYDGGGGIEVPLTVWRTLVEETDTIRYAKVSVQDPTKVRALLTELDGRVLPFAGKEEPVLLMLGNGAGGMVSGVSNVVPTEISAMYSAYVADNREQARAIFYATINPLVTMMFPARNEFIQCIKQCLAWQGVIASPATRHPLLPLDPVRVEELRAAAHIGGLTFAN